MKTLFRRRTDSIAPVRKPVMLAVAAIMLVAAALRAWHLDFGLPALNDPDEPIFILTSLDMLRGPTLNPGWFGHPATLLFYLLALVIVAVAGTGMAIGAWHGTGELVAAVFANPAVVVLPMRALCAVFGLASVWLTWRLGERVGGTRLGLIAALLIAVNALHVDLSQVIRTDMLATVLMTWSLIHALAIARGGGRRDHVWAGIAAGLACATKWPAILVLVAPLSAALAHRAQVRRELAIAPLVAIATLVIVSPYLLLDWHTVLRDLGGEARPAHLGSTGHGMIANLGWYVAHPLARGIGWAGVALVAIGAVDMLRDRASAATLLPFALAFLQALSAQALVWERWFVPLLPVAMLLAARGIGAIADLPRDPRHRIAAAGVLSLALAGSMAAEAAQRLVYRGHDARQAATRWALAHIPPGRTILVESAAFDLLAYRGRILFPLGSDGCIDARGLLAGHPTQHGTNEKRTGKAIVDLGHIDAPRLGTCRADYFILSNYGRYRHVAAAFPVEIATYRAALRGSRRVFAAVQPDPAQRAEGRDVEIYRAAGS